MDTREQPLQTTREFWDANPCGVHAPYERQQAQRYAMEPWLPPLLKRIASKQRSILEIGCGQGIDGIELCKEMTESSNYVGVDYSPASVAIAQENAIGAEAQLHARPRFSVGNAESLEFPDASFDAVYSMGVIHHTANDAAAIEEARRVLRPGCVAYICLYRRPSLKVGVAQALRLAQHGLDFILGTDRIIYRKLRQRASHSPLFGTMFLECFGVPYMKWYSETEIRRLFLGFSRIELARYGANLGRLSAGGAHPSRFGYFWLVTAHK
jgi:ubiquinone/menaquinone biosynthesis C-methylase UbiE